MLKVTPWFTDGAVQFLNGFMKWSGALSSVTGHQRTVLEVGGGGSTLYFLQKGFDVVCAESDPRWRHRIEGLARSIGCEVGEPRASNISELNEESVGRLCLVEVDSVSDIPGWVFEKSYSILVNDGIDRWRGLELLLEFQTDELLVADNLEYASDWGRLPVSAGFPERAEAWRRYLRQSERCWTLFEQPEGRDGFGVPDAVGLERPGRKITGVSWRRESILAQLGVTAEGSCLVSPYSAFDTDLADLRDRCPYPTEERLYDGLSLHRDYR